jgi:hypothetical protein
LFACIAALYSWVMVMFWWREHEVSNGISVRY